jgi:hypothetical protein
MGVFDRLPPMDHLRSEKMCYVQLIIPAECARIAVTYLGELGLLQFKDVSGPLPFFRCVLVLWASLSDLHDSASGVLIPVPLASVTLCALLDLTPGC